MQILCTRGRITPAMDKSNIVIPFSVPAGVSRLIVQYDYTPKYIEDEHAAAAAVAAGLAKYDMPDASPDDFMPVSNLVTLSFDENGAYRGACHRQPNHQTVIISDHDSTPGIYDRTVTPGEWQVVLNVHYAGCDIDYTIGIDGEVEQ